MAKDKPTRFISLDQVVANASTIIPNSDKTKRNIYKQWCYIGVREMGFPVNDVKQATIELDPESNSFSKPHDLLSSIDIALYDDADSEALYKYQWRGKKIHQDLRHPPVKLELSEDDNCFHLSSNNRFTTADGAVGTIVCKAKIRYYGLPFDENGELKIPEHYLMSLMYFIRYMDLMSRGLTAEANSAKNDWLVERARAKAKNKMPSMLEGQTIAMRWMSMIDRVRRKDF